MYQGVGAEVNRLQWEVSCLLEKESGSVLRLLWLLVPEASVSSTADFGLPCFLLAYLG